MIQLRRKIWIGPKAPWIGHLGRASLTSPQTQDKHQEDPSQDTESTPSSNQLQNHSHPERLNLRKATLRNGISIPWGLSIGPQPQFPKPRLKFYKEPMTEHINSILTRLGKYIRLYIPTRIPKNIKDFLPKHYSCGMNDIRNQASSKQSKSYFTKHQHP
jgi:hypothetical protein